MDDDSSILPVHDSSYSHQYCSSTIDNLERTQSTMKQASTKRHYFETLSYLMTYNNGFRQDRLFYGIFVFRNKHHFGHASLFISSWILPTVRNIEGNLFIDIQCNPPTCGRQKLVLTVFANKFGSPVFL